MEETKLKISALLYQGIMERIKLNPTTNPHISLLSDLEKAHHSGRYFIVTITTQAASDALVSILEKLKVRYDNHSASGKKTAIHCQNLIIDIKGLIEV